MAIPPHALSSLVLLAGSLIVGGSVASSASSTSAQRAKPPNIVFLLADDMGYGDVGYLSVAPANRRILTPNLDAMVKDGMAFDNAYAGAPVCAPSRCTLLTGRHSGHCSVRSNGPILSAADVCVPAVLKEANYKTAHFGKWGLGDVDTPASPITKGFDVYYGQTDQNDCHNYYPYRMDSNRAEAVNFTEYLVDNKMASPASCGADRDNCTWTGDIWTDLAVGYIHERTPSEPEPFFLYLSWTTPHAGGIGTNVEGEPPVPRISQGPYADKAAEWKKEVAYAAAVTEVDNKVGMVLKALDVQGLSDSTIVFFASDNGASNEGGHSYMFFNSSGPLQGYKRSLHEGGHRAPVIVKWPGHVPAGVLSHHQWSFYDFMATAADLAGLPPASLPPNDGLSMLDTLMGKDQDQPAFVYHEYCQPNESPTGWGQALRLGDFAAICTGPNLSAGTWPVCATPKIYNVKTDIGQTTDIASSHPDIVTTVMELFRSQHTPMAYCGAPAPTPPTQPTPPPTPLDPTSLTGAWIQLSNDHPAMQVEVAMSMSSSSSAGRVTITCVAPCTCCKWTQGNGTVVQDAAGTVQLDVVATGPNGFSTHEVGVAQGAALGGGRLSGEAGNTGLRISWRGDRGWADWTQN